jgi:putative SOS response-associated peptidase YedK
MRWGLVPSWWSKPLKELRLATFNARAETVTEKPFFREAFERTRCLIPVSGYYEWQDTPSGKQPYYFTARAVSAMTALGQYLPKSDVCVTSVQPPITDSCRTSQQAGSGPNNGQTLAHLECPIGASTR